MEEPVYRICPYIRWTTLPVCLFEGRGQSQSLAREDRGASTSTSTCPSPALYNTTHIIRVRVVCISCIPGEFTVHVRRGVYLYGIIYRALMPRTHITWPYPNKCLDLVTRDAQFCFALYTLQNVSGFFDIHSQISSCSHYSCYFIELSIDSLLVPFTS